MGKHQKYHKTRELTRQHKMKIAFESLLEFTQKTQKSTKELTMYDYQVRINEEHNNGREGYIGEAPDQKILASIERVQRELEKYYG